MAFREGTRASAVPDLLSGYPTRAVLLKRGALLGRRMNISHSSSFRRCFRIANPSYYSSSRSSAECPPNWGLQARRLDFVRAGAI